MLRFCNQEAYADTERKDPIWSVSKIQEYLDDFDEKKLSDEELIKLREELVYFEVNVRKKNLNGILKVGLGRNIP